MTCNTKAGARTPKQPETVPSWSSLLLDAKGALMALLELAANFILVALLFGSCDK